jgi:hypothetical protein
LLAPLRRGIMADKVFTVDEANALLPFLESHLRKLQFLQRIAQEKFEEMEAIKCVGYGPDRKLILAADFVETKEIFDKTVAEANAILGEINATGCQLKNIEQGLVDFPAEVEGQDVLLCWQVGEPEVLYFHDHYAGFQGRRPLPVRDAKE